MNSSLDRDYWRGRRVFVTGHTGFKGSWLCLWLESLGSEVTGYALEPPTTPSLFEDARVARGMRSFIGDVRDYTRLSAALKECRPEVIVHMAAQSVVKRGYADPIETFSSNVMGTANLLEAVRHLDGACIVVNVTSDKCYAPGDSADAHRESDAMGGDDPYSASKGCAELVTESFRRSFFPSHASVAVASARAGNAIGGGDWTSDQLIPDLIRGFLCGLPCAIRSPDGVRPWQFVLEPLRGYLMLVERLARDPASHATAWNFGPTDHDAKPVSWIADCLADRWGEGAAWSLDSRAHSPELATLRLDASKANAVLGWRPVLSLSEALDWIVDWYREWARGTDIRALTLGQIASYEQLLTSDCSGAAV